MSKHLDRDLENLQRRMIGFAGMVERAIEQSVRSLHSHNKELAAAVIQGDETVDRVENEVVEECLKMLALHQPVAGDLRRIAATLMITTDLERMGDLARHIAEVAVMLSDPPMPIPDKVLRMADVGTMLVRHALDSFVNQDCELARRVVRMDDEVDRYNDEIIGESIAYMKQSPENIERGLALYAATRHLERIVDHATNIAEDVIYQVEGEIVKHRPEAIAR